MIIKLLLKNEVTDALQSQLTELYKQLNADLTQLDLKTILSGYSPTDVAIYMDGETLAGIALMAKYKVISGHKGMIEDVVVSSDYRGKGIGRKLMEKLLEQAEKEKLNDVLLFSGHHRTAAISLYKSLGFKLKESGLYVKKYVK
ncbi:GNAT family N-acetyltransferase [Maribacter sp. ACAM166]|uniref:GNAT family N-acetyltransferase n=1 Tax=Maribacter sp. ACAM166 TaxID=2508996 RepID=UPI0010FD55AB|nr:GNAT family N-acetyltransferase [Maribacter sp. ACAM166]TLP81393.1 GNAT family N-acetyltransferase [Maribacter sp. ACAM166]